MSDRRMRCLLLHHMYAGTRSASIYHGAFRYQCNIEYLYHVKFEYAEEEMKKVSGWKKIQCHMKYHFYDRFMTLDGKDITK